MAQRLQALLVLQPEGRVQLHLLEPLTQARRDSPTFSILYDMNSTFSATTQRSSKRSAMKWNTEVS